MDIVVQKFGGTSVSTPENREACVTHIERELATKRKVVVVVSAMGRKGDPYATDTLLSLLGTTDTDLPKREMDLLLSTGELISSAVFSNLLHTKNIPNTVLTGGQAGIITNNDFGEAKITGLDPTPILSAFKTVDVVIVAGFQGISEQGETTTLGRGGSDTSATALGLSLNAVVVDIFTDVDGIFTADPRIVGNARSLSMITYNEIANLAHLGAKVIHPRAVEMAMQQNIPVRVRSTFSESEGTLITTSNELSRSKQTVEEKLVTGITQTSGIVQVKVKKDTHDKDFPLAIFDAMSQHKISVDFINVSTDEVVYTIFEKEVTKAQNALTSIGFTPQIEHEFAKVSLVGANITGVPGVMTQIIRALSEHAIPIYQSADSHTTIWILVKSGDMKQAVCALHDQFQLSR